MSVINILSPHVADLIAAGEVVERPASVVKELVENSIDAGAKNITVEIRGGGMKSIRVSDDGCGMSPEDAGTAFLRHATSKLRDERGLEAISTLGFRGEALAAISSVSRIELLTCEKGAQSGTRLSLIAGDIEEMGPAGCPEGTTITVRDLFYNTPARLKFMKSDRAETGACVNTALRCALGHPEVSIRMIRDGEEEFFTPGDGQAKSCVYSLLGRENAANMLSCSGEDEGVSVSGFVSAPHAGRGNRSMQFFFINGRSFRSATMQAALEQAYKNTLLTGRFPSCVLYICLSPGKVDVNVHPAKTEVKFSEEKRVFDAVYYAVLSALEEKQQRSTAEIKLSPGTRKLAEPRPDFFKNMNAQEFRAAQTRSAASSAPSRAQSVQTRMDLGSGFAPAEKLSLRSPSSEYKSSRIVAAPPLSAPPAPAPAAEKAEKAPAAEAIPAPIVAEEPAVPEFRLVGEALGTYIIVESGESMVLIDKHAAHERDIFDRLNRSAQAMSQSLLIPVTWNCGAAAAEAMENHAQTLEKLGFQIESYGFDSVIIRAVPAHIDGSEIATLEELLPALERGAEGAMDSIYHTIACKAAIKAGSSSQPQELRVLAEKVLSGQLRYCPHGRPVSVELSRKELDKFFKRIV